MLAIATTDIIPDARKLYEETHLKKQSDLPKPRNEMTEADWVAYDKTRYKTWYKSAGIILFKDNAVLLVQDKKSQKWSFPKGAPESEDNAQVLNTAVREAYEEVGLILDLDYTLDSTEYVKFPYDGYYLFGRIHPNAIPKVNDDEGQCVQWFTRNEIKNKIWNLTNNHIKHCVQKYL
jgi:8-oxo-dGTP pyrophosphatase MutT (NUDIX family)